MPYILEVEEGILALNEKEITNIVEKAHRSSKDLVFKQLHGHCYPFLRKHGGKNHHTLPSLRSLAEL